MASKFFNLSTDITLGGNAPSDTIVVSEKAIKTYVDTDLNGKVDKSSLSEVYPVVETYVNGESWYRVYSDNWCEQGGITTAVTNTNTTINLLKTYTDTNYELLVSSISPFTDAHGIVTITSKTIASATVQCFDHNNGNRAISASWQASGYIS